MAETIGIAEALEKRLNESWKRVFVPLLNQRLLETYQGAAIGRSAPVRQPPSGMVSTATLALVTNVNPRTLVHWHGKGKGIAPATESHRGKKKELLWDQDQASRVLIFAWCRLQFGSKSLRELAKKLWPILSTTKSIACDGKVFRDLTEESALRYTMEKLAASGREFQRPLFLILNIGKSFFSGRGLPAPIWVTSSNTETEQAHTMERFAAKRTRIPAPAIFNLEYWQSVLFGTSTAGANLRNKQ
jgi:hypothetical protein